MKNKAIILMLALLLATLAYPTTVSAKPTTTADNIEATPTAVKTTTPELTPTQWSDEPVYFMTWDYPALLPQISRGPINYGFNWKGEFYVEGLYGALTQVTGAGWDRMIGSLAVMHGDYFYMDDGSDTYVIDALTGSDVAVLEGFSGYMDIIYGQDFVAGNGFSEILVYTGNIEFYVETGAHITTYTLGASEIFVQGFGLDYDPDVDGVEIVLLLVDGSHINVTVKNFKNPDSPTTLLNKRIAINAGVTPSGFIEDINGDASPELVVMFTNATATYIFAYNTTLHKIGSAKIHTSYGSVTPTVFYAGGTSIALLENGTHVVGINGTDLSVLFEFEIPSFITESTYNSVPDTVTYAYMGGKHYLIFLAAKMGTATYHKGKVMAYVFNAASGASVKNITLAEKSYYFLVPSWVGGYGGDAGLIYYVNFLGPMFVINTTDWSFETGFLSVAGFFDYSFYRLSPTTLALSDSWWGYEVFSYSLDGTMNYAGLSMPILYVLDDLGKWDIDGDGNFEILVVTDGLGFSDGVEYWWFDTVDLTYDERFGPEEGKEYNITRIYNMLDVDPEKKVALITARNASNVFIFGWYNWSTGKWEDKIENFDVGAYVAVGDGTFYVTYRNMTSGNDYIAHINGSDLSILHETSFDAYFTISPWFVSMMLFDFTGDGVDDLVIAPWFGDTEVHVFARNLVHLFGRDIGSLNYDIFGDLWGTIDLGGDGTLEMYYINDDGDLYILGSGMAILGMDQFTFSDVDTVFVMDVLAGYPGDELIITDDDLLVLYYWDDGDFGIYGLDFGGSGAIIISLWLTPEADRLVALHSDGFASTFSIGSLSYEGGADILWPAVVDSDFMMFYMYFGLLADFNAFITPEGYLFANFFGYIPDANFELMMVGPVWAFYVPDIAPPTVMITGPATFYQGRVVKAQYHATDDLMIVKAFGFAEYYLIDGYTVTEQVQDAWVIDTVYDFELPVRIPTAYVDSVYAVSIEVQVVDLIWFYYDYIASLVFGFGYGTGHIATDWGYWAVDLESPTITVVWPGNDTWIRVSPDAMIILSFDIAENLDGPVYVRITVGGYIFDTTAYVTGGVAGVTIALPAAAFSSGQNEITITVTDGVGNTASIKWFINVEFIFPTETAEEATIVAGEARTIGLLTLLAVLFLGVMTAFGLRRRG